MENLQLHAQFCVYLLQSYTICIDLRLANVCVGKPAIPSISKLQKLVEEAWQMGYDPQGREQLGGRLCGTKTWIGATEIFAALSSLKVK